jgi:hypothetical protein
MEWGGGAGELSMHSAPSRGTTASLIVGAGVAAQRVAVTVGERGLSRTKGSTPSLTPLPSFHACPGCVEYPLGKALHQRQNRVNLSAAELRERMRSEQA